MGYARFRLKRAANTPQTNQRGRKPALFKQLLFSIAPVPICSGMSIGKTLSLAIAGFLAVGGLFVFAQNANLSPPKSLGYQSGTVAGFEFSAGRYAANSYITVNLAADEQIKVPVDASFTAPKIGQTVCIHSATQWVGSTPAYRFASIRKCPPPVTDN